MTGEKIGREKKGRLQRERDGPEVVPHKILARVYTPLHTQGPHYVTIMKPPLNLPLKMAERQETSVNAFVQVCERKYLAKSSHSKTNRFNWGKITYVLDNITENAGTISHADYLSALDLSSKVAIFNVNYRRPYLVVDLAVASSCHTM